jgi:hypothetical protein
MTFNLLLAGGLDAAKLTAALATLASVPIDAVDVVDADSPERDWSAAVSCVFEPLAGDITWGLDINFTDAVESRPTEAQVSMYLADHLAVPVLYPAEPFPPSAYWLAAPGGLRTRARVYSSDDGDPPVLTIDAVEWPVPSLPRVAVAAQPEVIREHRMPTPITDESNKWLATGASSSTADENTLWLAQTRLAAWESLTVRIASGWPPDGWYPADYYREDLETRDELATVLGQLPPAVQHQVAAAVSKVDDAFRAGTHEIHDRTRLAKALGDDAATEPRGWWWRRLPEPEPWLGAPGQTPSEA